VQMSDVWCVRAGSGAYAKQFVQGGYVGVNFGVTSDLSKVTSRDELTEVYRTAHPDETSNIVIGQQVGQLARFLLDMQEGDYVLTPAAESSLLHYGRLISGRPYIDDAGDSPNPIRRHVKWIDTLNRSGLSVPFQNTIRSSLTVFAVSQREEFLAAVDQGPALQHGEYDPYRAVLEQVLELTPNEFEILIGHLLTAVGFEGSEVTGRTGDGGVDVTGMLSVAGLAEVKVYVQAKRYRSDAKIAAKVVKQLRTAIPSGAQGAFITTADFQHAAADVADDIGFPRIGLINGHQLVDLLAEHWGDIPQEFQERLGLKKGLVRTA
jgi:predicted Mrr-cat superfamily restriction endonuclease